MFIIGKANQAEIEEMIAMGFDVEDVNVANFDAALDPSIDPSDPAYQEDRYEEHGDKLVSIFIDCDIVEECRSIKAEENA